MFNPQSIQKLYQIFKSKEKPIKFESLLKESQTTISNNDDNIDEQSGSEFESNIFNKPEGKKYKKLSIEGKITYLKDLRAELKVFFGKNHEVSLTSIDLEINNLVEKLEKKLEKKEKLAWIRDSLIGTGNSFKEIFEERSENLIAKDMKPKQAILFYLELLNTIEDKIDDNPDKKNRKKNAKRDKYINKIENLELLIKNNKNINKISKFRLNYVLKIDNFLSKKPR